MTDLTIFNPLYRELNALVETMRIHSGEVRTVPPLPINGLEAAVARRALTELVPHQRNIRKMMDGLRTNQLARYRGAGHQFVAYLVKAYLLQAGNVDSMSPTWSLPLTAELVQLVLPGVDSSVPDSVAQDLKLSPEQVDLLRVVEGSTVQELFNDLCVKRVAAYKKRRTQREAALERAKQVLSEEDLVLLLDKTLY